MKNFLSVSTLICLGMLGFSSTALAGKPTETVIAHCGCNYYGEAMEWQIITVNPNAKGHLQHVPGPEECLDENDENPVTLDRDFSFVSYYPSWPAIHFLGRSAVSPSVAPTRMAWQMKARITARYQSSNPS